jgi:hypothetical protein
MRPGSRSIGVWTEESMCLTKLLLSVFVLTLGGCATEASRNPRTAAPPAVAAASTVVRDGSSIESAIIIQANDEVSGVRAEHAWIHEHIPGGRPAGQALVEHDGRPYDLIHVKLQDGSVRNVFFDIASFFGRF